MSNNNNSGAGIAGFIAGALLGAAAGAAAGLLFAPQKGEATRRKVRQASDRMFKKGLEAVDSFQEERVEPFLNRVNDQASRVRDDITVKISDLKGSVNERLNKKPGDETAKE
ncbi:MAG: YtxH-like protein [candidate division WS6 bacterium OLB20]|uniref:YtxH-like protein n=1 Tax=candidate division WS6 bacterium OLB20 TaxID=1617426 RepID=A0A136LZH7_9BACT|nr:MAG: YtxH-like protein [candidate division WS6 bacterium OLB20]